MYVELEYVYIYARNKIFQNFHDNIILTNLLVYIFSILVK